MDDKFLYDNRPPVRQGFGASLYAQLSRNHFQQKKSLSWPVAIKFALAGWLIISLLLATSGPVRGNVLYWIRQVAGFQVKEIETIPGVDNEITLSPDVVNVFARIQENLPYEISFPAYVPDGFTFVDNVEVQGQSVFMTWYNENMDQVLMLVDIDQGQQYLAGKDAAQEIEIYGQPAMFFQGGYNQELNWDPNVKMINILQQKDEVIYWLIYVGNPDHPLNSEVVTDELVKMMSSLTQLP
jgi:hypothetical protein